jgi:RNA-binding protein 15
MDKLEKKDKFPNYLHHVPPEDDPLATRTLFAGNLELSITEEELRRIFSRYGVVEDVDIKRPMPGTGNAYAFVRYKNLDMAHRAKVELSGQYIGKFQCKIGYGKATPTTRIWVGGLGPWTSTAQLEREFDRFGAIKKIDYDKTENSAYILYDSIDAATAAVKEMRGFPLGGAEHKLRVDFADIGSRQPRPPPPPASSYDDVASTAGDYRVGVSNPDDHPYESYEPWHNNDYEYDHPPGIPPGVTLWSDRKNNDKESLHRGGLSPNNYSPKEDGRDGRDYENSHRYQRIRSRNSESDGEASRFNGALATARSLADITRCTTNAWQGALILKSSLFPAKFHITDGDGNIINVLMKSDESKHLLKISQRLRLDPAKLEDVSKRIVSSPGYGIFVGLPGPSSSIFFDETTAQCRPLRNLVSYLKQKEAAGVISLVNKDTEATGVLYAFPPCAYAADLLKRTAYGMSAEALKEDHLMIVVVKGGTV